MIKVALAGALYVALAVSASAEPSPVERGDYLVNAVMTCGNCHTPKGPGGEDIKAKAFSGGLEFEAPPFTVTAPNITPDKETCIGTWSPAQIKHLLRTGVRPNGQTIAPVMPTGFYGILTEDDLDAIVAYLQSLPAVANRVKAPVYRATIPPQVFPGAESPMKAADSRTPAARGFYLATIAHCMECHTPMGPKGHDFVQDLGRGGFELKGPWGVSVSRNITQSRTKGLGGWSDDEIKRAITKGVSKDGSRLAPPMSFRSYARMTAEDLDAVVAYLRTVPAKD